VNLAGRAALAIVAAIACAPGPARHAALPDTALAVPPPPPMTPDQPTLGWRIPGGKLLASRRADRVTVLDSGTVETWTFDSMIGPDRVLAVRAAHHVACDVDRPLAAYSRRGAAALDSEVHRVIVIASGSDTASLTGALRIMPVPAPTLDATLRVMLAGHVGAPHRDIAVAAGPGEPFFSLHAVYDTSAADDAEADTTGGRWLVRQGLFLHAADGDIVASKLEDVSGQMCDGCGIPRYQDDFAFVYRPLLVVRFPGEPRPRLLLDTSTIEGRALSLVTFADSGRYVESRDYEYVVNCFGGGA
jgi:hypothetical protein